MRYKGFILFLIGALLASHCLRFFMYAGFRLNQTYITQNFCENKNKPWLHCNGRCFLKKKLYQLAQKEQKQERESSKLAYQDAIFNAPSGFSSFLSETIIGYFTATVSQLKSRSYKIFQPPD